MSFESPVAIVGMGCKFPGGADTKDLFYNFIRNKGDGLVTPPSDRWDHAEWQGGNGEPGKYNSAKAGFINKIDSFDPLEFEISMSEAEFMDPSIRLALEVAHQALIDSGIDYKGSYTGVYYAQLLTSTGELVDDRYDIGNYHGLGKCIALRANRVSFTFDLRGPSLVVDTACSSAATAMHLALSAIRLGEISQALVIGGNNIIHPQHMVSFSKIGVLSPSGSSKSFDAMADGYARAEGFAAVLVKRLDKAVADGDHVYSVITGSSINSNGKGTSPTTPGGAMQVETIIDAYSRAKRVPGEAFYVELHATGTSVGDPIEANAAGSIFSKGCNSKRPLRVGSVKSNIGHTEGCSFLASLIKVSLMLKRKEILPNIRYKTPNPKINFAKFMMEVQSELEPLTPDFTAPDGKWIASVSCHGIGGSNAHVVLESFESASDSPPTVLDSTSNPDYLFIFAAANEASITRWKDALISYYKDVTDHRSLRSLSHDLARLSRSLPARAFAVGPAMSSGLELSKHATVGPNMNPKLCLVFSGQGPQHASMGKVLSLVYPAFWHSVKSSDEILVQKYGRESFLNRSGLFVPEVKVNLPEDGVWPVQDVVYSIVFVQLALVELLQSLGIKYDYVMGHSLGEVAMGYASGYYSKQTAIGIAIARAEAMKQAEGNGGVVALGVGVQKATSMIKEVLRCSKSTGGLWIAAINSPKAVAVAGKKELIDALIERATRLNQVFVARLRVTCAFHTPLMEPHEDIFKQIAKSVISEGSNAHVARVMSTVDGKWLDRDLDLDYCWDNIRQPVLFGTAIHQIVKEHDDGDILFIEVAPHPVLNVYIEHSDEHRQLLEGIGQLLIAGFKAIDLSKFCATPDGITDFVKCNFPEHPYNRSPCWGESEQGRSVRLRRRPRPLASSLFRLSVDTHPDLAGHVIFDVPLFPASGYLESILESGAMIVKDVQLHRPLVLNTHGDSPAYVGCIVRGNKWEFRAATANEFDNGNIELDTVFATASFLLENPRCDPNHPKILGVDSMLSRSRGLITGAEFYKALPSAYGYRDHFSDCIEEVREVYDENSWFGIAYLAKLEIPPRTHDFPDKGYVIHPSILDSIIHSALAIFINMDTKLSDFNHVFLPVKIDALSRWDSTKFADIISGFRDMVWVYIIVRAFAPEGPIKFNYTVADSQDRVILTIEGFELALEPQADQNIVSGISTYERLTSIWQPNDFPSSNFSLHPHRSADILSDLRSNFETLIVNAQMAGRHVVRVLDMTQSLEIVKVLDASLVSLFSHGLLVDYFFTATSAEDIEVNLGSLQYSYIRPLIADVLNDYKGEHASQLSSFDVLLQMVEVSRVPTDLATHLGYLVPFGVVLLLVAGRKFPKESYENSEIYRHDMTAFVDQLRALPHAEVSIEQSGADALILIRSDGHHGDIDKSSARDVAIHHFQRGTEGEIANIVANLSDDSELWIVGNDNAPGIGALGVVACMAAESPAYTIHSLIFENHDISQEARERIIHSLRETHLHLEQHLKYTLSGEIFVRRLIYGSSEVKDNTAPGLLAHSLKGTVSPYFPPCIKPTDVQVSVRVLGVDSPSSEKSLVSFVGKITDLGADVKNVTIEADVVGVTDGPITDIVVVDQNAIVALPDGLTDTEAAALPMLSLAAWLALVETVRILDGYTILIHDASSRIGVGAVQICRRFGAKFFCTVLAVADAADLAALVDVDMESIAVILPGDDFKLIAQQWLTANRRAGFDVIFNTQSSFPCTAVIDLLKHMGHYIHIQRIPSDKVDIPSGAPTTNVIDVSKILKHQPSKVVSCLSALLVSHALAPFKVPLHAMLFSHFATTAASLTSSTMSLVAIPEMLESGRIDPTVQLFDPRKTYILLGGSSELGVRIARWMVTCGARHLVLTSRRGPAALTKIDLMYLHYLRSQNVSVEVLSSDARDRRDTITTINRANEIAPLDGIFLMTVVLHDATISRLTQESFDDVYLSKVHTLNTLLSCVNTTDLRFLLLFSTIGSVFGNAGQAAYCASQSYLDRMAEILPNTISISLPPITDAGMFKRLVRSTKSRPHIDQLAKTGITVAKACSFICDCLVRKITHYVPMIAIKDVPQLFPTCEPLLYSHLLPRRLVAADKVQGRDEPNTTETPTTLLAAIVGLKPEQISESSVITRFGLDSLGAVRFSHELKAHLDIKISQAELLGPATIRFLNEKLRKTDKTSVGLNLGVERDDGAAKYATPLTAVLNELLAYGGLYTTDATPHQYRMWLAQSNRAGESTEGRSYHQGSQHGVSQWGTHEGYLFIVAFSAPVDTIRIRGAMAEIIQRHGALRTAFSLSDEGILKQTVHSNLDFQMEVVDLSYEVDARKIAYEMSLAVHKNPNFLLDQLPLLVFTMFDLGNREWGFNVVFHHSIMDKSSLSIIFRELFTLYLMGVDNVSLPGLHYSDFSDWLFRTSDVRAQLKNEQLKFWTENLRDVQPLHLTLATPTDELLSPITEIESTIDVRPLKRFHTLISEAEATPFCGFFAAYNILLFKCSSQSSFAVGTVVDQRNIAQLANVVGFFANILPVKTYIDASQTFPQYLTSFKGDLLKSLENDDVAYEDILSHSGDPSPFGGYFRHMFTFSGLSLDAIEELELDGIQVRTIIPLPKVGDQSELSLTVHSSTGRVVLQFDNHLFSEETARMLLTAYVTLVKNLGRDSSVKIREVSATANEYDCLGVRLSRVGEGARAKLYTEKA